MVTTTCDCFSAKSKALGVAELVSNTCCVSIHAILLSSASVRERGVVAQGLEMVAQGLEGEMEEMREQHQAAAASAAFNIQLLQQQVAERDGNLASLRAQLASAEQTRKSDALQVYSVECLLSHSSVTTFC